MLKKGDNIKMAFTGAGETSYEYWPIVKITEEYIFLMGGRSSGDEPFMFDRKSGRCVNDDNTLGFHRSITPQ